MIASYLETIGFKNGVWEFNYRIDTKDIVTYSRVWNSLLHHFLILGGASNIDITGWDASDDTLLILAVGEAICETSSENADSETETKYSKQYINYYDLLFDEKRASGLNTIDTIKLLKRGINLKTLLIKPNMGGNGAAMRTGPIGLKWFNNIDKVIEESIIASRLTHNYYLGFLGGMVTALFTSFAMNDIKPWNWCEELIKLYNNKTIHKYYPVKDGHKLEDLDEYIGYWKRYQETRISKLKYKNTLDNFIYPEDRTEFLLGFFPDQKIKNMTLKGMSLKKLSFDLNRIGSTGLDSCIYAYDCLLMSINTPNSKTIDFDNVVYSWDTFSTLVAIHPGDNDTTGAIGGTWYGALLGFNGIDKNRMKQLEFYNQLLQVANKIK